MNDTRKSASSAGEPTVGFTEEERAAMKERVKEVKAAKRGKGDTESDVLAKIAEMPEPDRSMAQRLHEIIRATVPELVPRLYYGMPAYAKDGKVLCFFQNASKFKSRYATFGFNDPANLDDGQMWPTAFALTGLNDEVEAKIIELVQRAAS